MLFLLTEKNELKKIPQLKEKGLNLVCIIKIMGCPKLTYHQENEPTFFKVWKNPKSDFEKVGLLDYGARFYDPVLGRFHTLDTKAESYYSWSLYNYTGNNPIRRIDINGESWGDVGKMIKSYIARKANQAILSTTSAAIHAVRNVVRNVAKDIVKHTSVQAKGKIKITEELGAQIELKGVGGAGMSIVLGEATITSEMNISIADGKLSGKLESTNNKNVTYEGKGQVGGNGAFAKYTEGADGSTSTEGGITTSTGVPGVQTESSLKLGSKTTEVSSGFAIGAKTPVAVSTTGKVVHLSVGASFKLVYKKDEE